MAGPAGAAALLAAVLLPPLFLGLVLALDHLEERLLPVKPAARKHRAARRWRTGRRGAKAHRRPPVPSGTPVTGPRAAAGGPPMAARVGSARAPAQSGAATAAGCAAPVVTP